MFPSKMSSRERFLAAINFEDVDHIPLYFRGSHRYLDGERGPRNQFEKALNRLKFGVEDFVGFGGENNYHYKLRVNEDVKSRTRKEVREGERYPLLIKDYETPKGPLKQVVRQTIGYIGSGPGARVGVTGIFDNWTHGDNVPIFSDHLIPKSRSVEYLVKGREDLEPFSCLFRDMTKEELNDAHRDAEEVKRFVEENEVLLATWGPCLGDAAIWACGVEKIATSAFKDPKFLHGLLDIIHDWDMRMIRVIHKLGGGDLIIHRGWYENSYFWSPRMFREFLAPRLKEEVELAHQGRVKHCMLVDTGIMPLLGILKETGIDVLWGVDPVQGGADLKRVKEELGDKVCLWGGMNSAVTLSQGTKEEIRAAVKDAIATLAPGGGFVLSPVDCLYEDAPSENIAALLEAWREMYMYK